jgi:hypothetical protein
MDISEVILNAVDTKKKCVISSVGQEMGIV